MSSKFVCNKWIERFSENIKKCSHLAITFLQINQKEYSKEQIEENLFTI